MGFANVKSYVDALNGGRMVAGHFRKVPGLASVASWWTDLSMAAGNPPAQYYASNPYVSAVLGKYDGLFHGDDKTPAELYLADMMLVTPTAAMVGQYTLLDMLLYYPFVDLDDTSAVQPMTQSAVLPRYASGVGVQAMLVAQAPTTGNGTFTFTYLDENGVEQTSPTQYYTPTGANMGSIVTSQPAGQAGLGPYLKLASGSKGVRAITSHTNTVANGGLGAYVLVKPLADITINEINTPNEITLVSDRPGPPRIYDGAVLSFIANTAGSIQAGLLTGRLNFAWTS